MPDAVPTQPRAAYLHVPFCRHRCGYCNFTVVAGRDDLIDRYLDAVERELSWLGTPRPVDTIFLGGGTPTHLPPEKLRRLLSIVRNWFPVAEGYEFSVEANPSDVNESRAETLVEFGVTRISLGVQSFDAAKLERLERDHRREQIQQAVELSRRFASVSLDLIFGVPGETLDDWQRDLQAAIELRPDHVSTYGLTFEKGTTFWGRRERGELRVVDEDLERDMYLGAIDTLSSAGFEHYEVSNFARPGHRCRHNEVYWLGGEYFAAGPGAARYVGGIRELNHRATTTYLHRVLSGRSPVAEREQLDPESRARERLVFGLRRLEGVTRSQFETQSGFAIDALVGPALRRFVELGLLVDDGERIRLTRSGLLVSDAIWPEFLAR